MGAMTDRRIIWVVRVCGLLVVAASVWMFLVSLGVVDSEPSPTPPWLQALVALCFFMAGLYIVVIGRSGQPGGSLIPRLIHAWSGPVIIVALTILVNWIAFGPGSREGEGGIDLPFIYLPLSGEFSTRLMFGFSALVLDLIWLRGLYWLLVEKGRQQD
jgi:hypothetical protein